MLGLWTSTSHRNPVAGGPPDSVLDRAPGLTPGTEWGASIINGIDSCRIMVLIFSTHANESGQVRREVERAISKGITILPVRVQDVRPAGAMAPEGANAKRTAVQNTAERAVILVDLGYALYAFGFGKQAIAQELDAERVRRELDDRGGINTEALDQNAEWLVRGGTSRLFFNDPLKG